MHALLAVLTLAMIAALPAWADAAYQPDKEFFMLMDGLLASEVEFPHPVYGSAIMVKYVQSGETRKERSVAYFTRLATGESYLYLEKWVRSGSGWHVTFWEMKPSSVMRGEWSVDARENLTVRETVNIPVTSPEAVEKSEEAQRLLRRAGTRI